MGLCRVLHTAPGTITARPLPLAARGHPPLLPRSLSVVALVFALVPV